MVYLHDPSETQWMPKCPFYVLTGWKCPSCGVTRAAYHLMHGSVSEAIAFNPALLALVPLAIAICALACMRPSPKHDRALAWAVWTWVALYCAWWIIRNIFDL